MKKILGSLLLIVVLVSISYAQDVESVRRAKSEAIYIGNVLHSCRLLYPMNPCVPQGCTSNEVEMRDAILSVRNINPDPTDHIMVRLTLRHLTLCIIPPCPTCATAIFQTYVYPTRNLGPYEGARWSINDLLVGPSWEYVTNPNPSCPPLKLCDVCDYSTSESGMTTEGYFWLEWWSASGKAVNAPAVGGMIRYQDSTGFRLSSDFKPVVVFKNIKIAQ